MANTSQDKKPFHVAVCGGGIAGLCLTIGLLHHNIPCTLYEAAGAFAEIGAGVACGPNALQALGLIDPEISTGYHRLSTTNASPEKKLTWFDFRIGMREDAWKGIEPPGKEGQVIANVIAGKTGQSTVHRAHFLDVLVSLIPQGVAKFGKRVEKVENVEGKKMRMTFDDGTTADADAVVGCDGVKSRIRQILLGEKHESAQPTFTGKYAYRGLIPMEKAVDALGDELARNSQQYLGQYGHVLTFPIERGKTMNVVAFRTKMDGKWDDERWVLPVTMGEMVKDFEGWGDNVQKIISLMEKPDKWAIFDHPAASTYYSGHLAMMGDAAHASSPHQGAGAGQAIEDAYMLSNLLGRANSVSDIERAFHAYDAICRPRSQKVVKTSRETGMIYEFENERLANDLALVGKTLESRYDWIWNVDLPAHLQRAVEIMDGVGGKVGGEKF